MTEIRIRRAVRADAPTVARLHADSWRRHYRGAYSDAYLDGDVLSDRLAVWEARLSTPGSAMTFLAEDDEGAAAFLHLVFDEDPLWGSFIDNLHVAPARQRTGVGRALVEKAAEAAVVKAVSRGMYLWVLEQNDAAQAFYRALGGAIVEKARVTAPKGAEGRLVGAPGKLRVVWTDVAAGLSRPTATPVPTTADIPLR